MRPKNQFTITGNKTITGSPEFGNTVFTSLNDINVAGSSLTVTPGTRFVVGEISGVFKEDDESRSIHRTYHEHNAKKLESWY